MADVLYPILAFGEVAPGDLNSLMQYRPRDFRGVETPASAPADRRGVNEEAEHTERCDAAWLSEHAANRHNTHKIPRTVLVIDCDTTPATPTYAAGEETEHLGVRHGTTSVITSVTRTGAGVVVVVLATALMSVDIQAANLTQDDRPADLGALQLCRAYLKTVNADKKTLTFERWEGDPDPTGAGPMVKTDGSFTVELVCE